MTFTECCGMTETGLYHSCMPACHRKVIATLDTLPVSLSMTRVTNRILQHCFLHWKCVRMQALHTFPVCLGMLRVTAYN